MKNIIVKFSRFLIISLAFTGTAALSFANAPVKPELKNSSTTAAINFAYAGPEFGIEDWMTDLSHWGFPYEYEATEVEGGIEGWMVNTLYWNYPSEYEATEAEGGIEGWMVNTLYWNYPSEYEATQVEGGIEGWMVNTLYWNYPSEYELAEDLDNIEDWMMNPYYWDTVHKHNHECADNNNPAVIQGSVCMNKWNEDSGPLVKGG